MTDSTPDITPEFAPDSGRRGFLRTVATAGGATVAMTSFPPAIQRALAIGAHRKTGTIRDVEHVVILTQENRSFDHYFGTLNGVRGFGDRFPIPVPESPGIAGKTVWVQPNATPGSAVPAIAPFHLNTVQNFDVMRVQGTPHSWSDAQPAWNNGQLNAWPLAKQNHSMGHYAKADLPFQFALADAFTLCDAYHCAFHGGTNTNRLFLWTGTNDPLRKGNGPATYNDYDWFDADHGDGGYAWTTYPERLQKAGISWQVYENMADNFTDNSLAGFKTFRDAWFKKPGCSQALLDRGASTRDLDQLKQDVLAGKLPQVSWIVATAEGSEHPGPSSPAQGADYTAKVLDALTANPEVWSKTVLFVNFDENDGFFDHVPPPAAPSYVTWNADPSKAVKAGASTVDTTGEYHEILLPWDGYANDPGEQALLHRAYGLGPRVPMYVISPWSKGGWVNSQVADHTSVIRFLEQRFGVMEPNISAWRRAVCGDLSSCFNFADPDDSAFFQQLPDTVALANRARALQQRTTPPDPTSLVLPVQASGVRPSRALPYELHVTSRIQPDVHRLGATQVTLRFANTGRQTAVFHVYDRLHLDRAPRRYTVEPTKQLQDSWQPASGGQYDLWVLGPGGFHRHFSGNARRVAAVAQPNPDVVVGYDVEGRSLLVTLLNSGPVPAHFSMVPNAYFAASAGASQGVVARSEFKLSRALTTSAGWYDFSVKVAGQPDYVRRFAGRIETGLPSVSDPAMGGVALAQQWRP